MTVQKHIEWWDDQFKQLVYRARNGEQNLELAGAMCVGAIKALKDYMKEEAQ